MAKKKCLWWRHKIFTIIFDMKGTKSIWKWTCVVWMTSSFKKKYTLLKRMNSTERLFSLVLETSGWETNQHKYFSVLA